MQREFEFGGFEFEWDDDKAAANVNKHNVPFEEAATIFDDDFLVTIADLDHSEGEDRYACIGISRQGHLLKVIYVERGRKFRIISARRPTSEEKHDYEYE